LRSLTVSTFVVIFATLGSDSESLDDEESDEEAAIFFGALSERVALVSDPGFLPTFFSLTFFSEVESLSELDDESSSEPGSGIFLAKEWVEESESEPELLELLLPGELKAFFGSLTFLAFETTPSEPEEESELESDSEEELLLESDLEDGEPLTGADTETAVLTFFGFGASSSEVESELDEDESLLEDAALRFRKESQ